jgi:GNAT superfamily N-acetyltransferase
LPNCNQKLVIDESQKGDSEMSDITFRSLYPEDINQVSEIENSLTGSPKRAFLEKRLALTTPNLGEIFQDELGGMSLDPQAMPDAFITCAAFDGKKLAGYGFARILEGEFGARNVIVELDDIGVAPDYQGKGIAKMVIAGIEQRMIKKGISTLRTQVIWSSIPMIRFFASTGFTLASGQIIERDTSPLSSCVAGGNYHDNPDSDRIKVRPLQWEDLATVDRIDAKLTGLDRSAYIAAKFREMLDESGIRISMVAEDDGIVTGFIMARVDYGEFGKVAKAAVLDTIGVHHAHAGSGIGHALLSQLLINLSSLQVKSVRTKVEQENSGLRNFLLKRGFKPSQRLLLTREIH